jgi:hypothetical protein
MAAKSIYQLAKEWRIIQAQLKLDVLKTDSDNKVGRLTHEADAKAAAILEQILATLPKDGDDMLAVVDIVIARLSEASVTEGDWERELLRHVRPWFWKMERQREAA